MLRGGTEQIKGWWELNPYKNTKTARDSFSSALPGSRPTEERKTVASVQLKASRHVLLYTSPLLSNGYQQQRKADKEALFLTTAPESLALWSSGDVCQAGMGFVLPARRRQWSNMFLDRKYKKQNENTEVFVTYLRLWAISCRFRKAAWLVPLEVPNPDWELGQKTQHSGKHCWKIRSHPFRSN